MENRPHGSFTIYERGLPAASVYTYDAPKGVPYIMDVPASARGAALRAHVVTFMSEDGDLWLIKADHHTGPLPKLLLSSSPVAPLIPMPIKSSVLEEIRRKFNRDYLATFRAEIIQDVGVLLAALESKVGVVNRPLGEVIPLFPKGAA